MSTRDDDFQTLEPPQEKLPDDLADEEDVLAGEDEDQVDDKAPDPYAAARLKLEATSAPDVHA
ncbi:hypothetical protein OC834_007615, partial [Tilletia horrida]